MERRKERGVLFEPFMIFQNLTSSNKKHAKKNMMHKHLLIKNYSMLFKYVKAEII
jgi:hypothetical protein